MKIQSLTLVTIFSLVITIVSGCIIEEDNTGSFAAECPRCEAGKTSSGDTCQACGGKGFVTGTRTVTRTSVPYTEDCSSCDGGKTSNGEICQKCNGTGSLTGTRTEKKVTNTID